MAISVDNTTTSANTLTFSHTVGADATLLVVLVSTHSSDAVTGITYNGAALTESINYSGSYRRVAIFYKVSPSTGANNVVVSVGANTYGVAITAISLNGTKLSSPIETTGTGDGYSSTPSKTITSSVEALVLGAVSMYANGAGNFTVGSGQTELADFQSKATPCICSGVTSKAGAASVSISFTATGVSDNYYAIGAISILQGLDVSISEDITFNDTEVDWVSPETLQEGFTLNDTILGSREFFFSITEDITFSEAMAALYELIVSETVTIGEALSNEQLVTLAEAMGISEDAICPYYFESITDAINFLQQFSIENANATWREERSINMVGQHIQLKFRNNEVEQGLYLRDIKTYWDRYEDRKAIEAGDYVGEHVRFKIQNNVIDESLYLEYIRIIGIFRGLLGWSV